jgi:prophage regulatory protein
MVRQYRNNSDPPHQQLYRLPAVKYQTGLGRSSIYDGVSKGTFPSPIKIGARAVAWLADEIAAWIDARIKASREKML